LIHNPNNSSIGGAAGEGGGRFRASAGAWFATQALVGQRVDVLGLGVEYEVPLGGMLPESGQPTDDLEIHLNGGGRVFCQVKTRVDLTRAKESDFGKTVRQFADQILASGFDPTRMCCALVVANATGSLRTLQRVLRRAQAPSAGALTKREVEVKDLFLGHLSHLTQAEKNRVLHSSRVLVLDIASPERPGMHACITQLEAGVVGPGAGPAAWLALTDAVSSSAESRTGLSLDLYIDALRRAGLEITHTRFPCGERVGVLDAVERYRSEAIERGGRLSVRALHDSLHDLRVVPNTRSVMVVDLDNDESRARPLGWALRRTTRLLVLGAPGIGKSSALRRLAAEHAATAIGPLPLFVHLPFLFAPQQLGATSSGNRLETLIRVGLQATPPADRDALEREFFTRLTKDGTASLLLDSLDECRDRRHTAIEIIETALRDVHPDAEVVLATRDAAYATAHRLGFAESTLQAPQDLSATIHELTEMLADDLRIDPGIRPQWLADLRVATRSRGFLEPDRRGPLARLGAAIVAAHKGVGAIGRDEASEQAALVDWLAERWEIRRRDDDFSASAQLSSDESTRLLIDAFDVIAHALSSHESCTRADVEDAVASFAVAAWELPPKRASSAAKTAVAFWDEAGVFVARGADASVRASQETLRELGHARHLARQTPEELDSWIRSEARQPERARVVELLAGLSRTARRRLLLHAAGDINVLFSVARGMATATGRDDESAESEAADLHGRLLDVVRGGGSRGWEALELLLDLPAPADTRGTLELVRSVFAEERASLAEAMIQVMWTRPGVDLSPALDRVRRGPPAKWPAEESAVVALRAEPSFGRFLVALAKRITPLDRSTVEPILSQNHVSGSAYLELRAVLRERGCEPGLLDRGWDGQDWAAIGRHSEEAEERQRAFLEHVARLSTPAHISYGDRRRLTEFLDFERTAVPGEMVASAFHWVMEADEVVPALLELVAVLGGFDRERVVAQLEVMREEGLLHQNWWRLDGEPRGLSMWPENDTSRRALLARVVALFRLWEWGAHLAIKAVLTFPAPAVAAIMMFPLLPALNVSLRLRVARVALELDEDALERARLWIAGEDPAQRRAAALYIASRVARGEADATDLRCVMRAADEATCEAVRDALAELRTSLPSAVTEVLAESACLPGGPWFCMWCGNESGSGASSCEKCHAVRRSHRG
jgi:hypothetical protein